MQIIFLVIVLIVIVIQVVLRAGILMGKPWSDAVFADPFRNWRAYSIFAIAGYVILTVALLLSTSALHDEIDPKLVGLIVGSAMLVCVDTVNTVFSRHKKERTPMGPHNLLSAVSLIVFIFSY